MREQLYACEPQYLLTYLTKLENATAEEVALAAGQFGADHDDPLDEIYEEDGDEARIKVSGPLTQEPPSFLAKLFGFGGTSYDSILKALDRAHENPIIKRLRLIVNSPGGEVAGVDHVWQALRAWGPNCVAENHGLMASAAYWMSSACDKIVAMSPAAEQGSIGVVAVGIDDSDLMKNLGIKKVTILSKNAPNKSYDFATTKGRSAIQDRANEIESVFISRVAEGRHTTVEKVKADFGGGRVKIAEHQGAETCSCALHCGMIDSVAPMVPDNASRRQPGADFLASLFEAPLPNFHSCRLAEPNGEKTRYAKGERKHGEKSYDVIYQKKKGSDSWEEQAYRYPKGSWESTDASKHCASHKGKFEGAKDTKSGGKRMTLAEALVDSQLKTEFEAKITEARAEGKVAFEARVAAAKPYLSLKATADGYDDAETEAIAKCAVDVITGAEEPGALKAFVRMVDMSVEKRKLTAAQGETTAQRETPGQHTPAMADLIVKANAQKIDLTKIDAAAKKQGIDPLKAIEATIEMNEQLERDKKILASLGG